MTHKIDGPPPAPRAMETAAAASSARTASGTRNAPVAATAAVDRVSLTGDAEGLQSMGRQLSAPPAGIDMVRVNAIKSAIAEGRYTVDAQTVAIRMLGLEQALDGKR